jgi:hypothetical protein
VTTSSFIPIDSCLCVFIDDAFHEGGGGEVIDLPPAELATLPQIAKVGAPTQVHPVLEFFPVNTTSEVCKQTMCLEWIEDMGFDLDLVEG